REPLQRQLPQLLGLPQVLPPQLL
ncbi:wall surface anchor family domain protein, partial [Chlamydia psittaci 06-1683]